MKHFATQKELNEHVLLERHSVGSRLQEIIAASGISMRVWRLYAYFWLVCLLFPILSLVQTPQRIGSLLVAVSGLVLFTAVYFWVMWPHPLIGPVRRFPLRTSLWLIISLTTLTLLLTIRYGEAFLWLFICVSAIAGLTLSFRNASIAVMALTLLTMGVSVAMSGEMKIPNPTGKWAFRPDRAGQEDGG